MLNVASYQNYSNYSNYPVSNQNKKHNQSFKAGVVRGPEYGNLTGEIGKKFQAYVERAVKDVGKKEDLVTLTVDKSSVDSFNKIHAIVRGNGKERVVNCGYISDLDIESRKELYPSLDPLQKVKLAVNEIKTAIRTLRGAN